jgi:hypothetical protein
MLPGRYCRQDPETFYLPGFRRADARNRTGDPFITSEVLYQLSYVGVCRNFPDSASPVAAFRLRRAAKS